MFYSWQKAVITPCLAQVHHARQPLLHSTAVAQQDLMTPKAALLSLVTHVQNVESRDGLDLCIMEQCHKQYPAHIMRCKPHPYPSKPSGPAQLIE